MNQARHLTHEADIGSGERSAGQQETDKMIEQVPPNKPDPSTKHQSGRQDRNGPPAQSGNPP